MNELKKTKRRRVVQKNPTFFSLPDDLQFLILILLTPSELNNFLITCKCFCYRNKILEQKKNNLTYEEKYRKLMRYYSPNNPKNNYLKVLFTYCNSEICTKILRKQVMDFFTVVSCLIRDIINHHYDMEIFLSDVPCVMIYMPCYIFDNYFVISKIILNITRYYNNLNIKYQSSYEIMITNKKKTLFEIYFKNNFNYYKIL